MVERTLKEIENGNQKIINWEFIQPHIECRVYFKQINSGFVFCSVLWVGCPANEDLWTQETYVEVSYNGIAYFDGIRHLYIGDEQTDNHGYDYYPNIDIHLLILNTLKQLEKKYCTNLDDRSPRTGD